jgi:4-carboxymuconolactone decarboxylase
MARLAQLTLEEMTPEQRQVHDDIVAGPRGRVVGPMNAWFRSPKLCDRAQKLGAFCRFESSLPARIREFAILLVAREWTAQIEWWAHKPLALDSGLDPAIADAIEARRRPEFVNEDEEIVYDLFAELHESHAVSDASYARALDAFGEVLLVELIALFGYYTSVAMILNTFEELPSDGSRPLAP